MGPRKRKTVSPVGKRKSSSSPTKAPRKTPTRTANQASPAKTKRKTPTTTPESVAFDLESLVDEYWMNDESETEVSPPIIQWIYDTYLTPQHMHDDDVTTAKEGIHLLLTTDYLTKILWKQWSTGVSSAHHWSICSLLACLSKSTSAETSGQIETIMSTHVSPNEAWIDWLLSQSIASFDKPYQRLYLEILTLCFHYSTHVDCDALSMKMLRLVSLPIWSGLSPFGQQREFHQYPKLARHWNNYVESKAKDAKSSKDEADLVPQLLVTIQASWTTFFESAHDSRSSSLQEEELYIRSSIEFFLELLSQFPTRRFVVALLMDTQFHIAGRVLLLPQYPALRSTFNALDDMLYFPMHAHTGVSITTQETQDQEYTALSLVQQLLFQYASSSGVTNEGSSSTLFYQTLQQFRTSLRSIVESLEMNVLQQLAQDLHLVAPDVESKWTYERKEHHRFLVQVVMYGILGSSSREKLKTPTSTMTETLLFDTNTASSFVVPPVNVQYLNWTDFWTKQRSLFQMEFRARCRRALEHTLDLVQPRYGHGHSSISFYGPPSDLVLSVAQTELVPGSTNVGQSCPTSVVGKMNLNLNECRHEPTKREWDSWTHRHQSLVVMNLSPPLGMGEEEVQAKRSRSFLERYGIISIRLAEVVDWKDGGGSSTSLLEASTPPALMERNQGAQKGTKRQLSVAFDPRQYQEDLDAGTNIKELYHHSKIIMRLPRLSSWNGIAHMIQDYAGEEEAEEIPLAKEFQDLILGIGDPTRSEIMAKFQLVQWDSTSDQSFPPLQARGMFHEWVTACPPQRKMLIVASSSATLEALVSEWISVLPHESTIVNLASAGTFSRFGRVNWILHRRLELLDQVRAVAQNLLQQDATIDYGANIDTALLFHHQYGHMLVEEKEKGISLTAIMAELVQYQAYEILRTIEQRTEYLLLQQSQVVLCTYAQAGLFRREWMDQKFAFQSLLCLESEQMLELETLVPFTISPKTLERVMMLGDQEYPALDTLAEASTRGHLNQSLCHRLRRLGVPVVGS